MTGDPITTPGGKENIMLYTIEWMDGEVEYYETKSEQVARINKLEEQGYVMFEDFTIAMIIAE